MKNKGCINGLPDVLVVHDWDFPLYRRKTCLRRGFWLILYAFFGRFRWFRERMPRWLLYEKYNQALALALLDKLFGIKAIFGITKEVESVFPDVKKRLEELGFEVRHHYHVKQRGLGKGRWTPPLDVKPENMIYDRLYALHGRRELPRKGEAVVWHVDHLNYNLLYYLEFVRRCKDEGLL